MNVSAHRQICQCPCLCRNGSIHGEKVKKYETSENRSNSTVKLKCSVEEKIEIQHGIGVKTWPKSVIKKSLEYKNCE